MNVIKTQTQYEEAMARIESLMERDPEPETEAAEELELLGVLIEVYERAKFRISAPDPIEAIRFRMDQEGLRQKDLAPYIGSRSKVSEVLARKRPLTLSMIRALHEGLGLSADVLVREAEPLPYGVGEVDWGRFPIREMVRRGWIDTDPKDRERAAEAVREWLSQLEKPEVECVLLRQSRHVRAARDTDDYALAAWTARILVRAGQRPPKTKYVPGSVTDSFLRAVAQLSWSDTGPLLAREYLENHGIRLVVERHLPRTYIDGAAILCDAPVIALSLRHDRLDSFWFCLTHELAHLALHEGLGPRTFYDDLDVVYVGDEEAAADDMASEALIPGDVWREVSVDDLRSATAVRQLAQELHVHPAVVATRVRQWTGNNRIHNQLMGHGHVRRLFESE